MAAPLVVQQGIASGYAWPIVDDAGQPVELVGWSARCQVRRTESHSSELLAELTATVEGSTVELRWTPAESMAWAWVSGYCDVLLIDPGGVARLVVWQGIVQIDRVVTHVE